MSCKENQTLNVILIEFYPYHSELIYSQLLFLTESDFNVTLICDQRNAANSDDFRGLASVRTYDFKKIASLFKLWLFLLSSKSNYVIFNTAQGSRMLKFALFWLPKRIKLAGIIHNTKKLKASFGQKLISRKVKSYFVLASYMQKFFPYGDEDKIKSEFINCSYLPQLEEIEIKKQSGEIWLGIPGSIEYKRRDYEFLLELVKSDGFPNHVCFILLGNSLKGQGPEFISNLKKLNVENNFKWFEGYVSDELFASYMEKVDYLFPLIHPVTASAEDYLKYKVSGTFIQSRTYQKPMICHQIFNTDYFDYSAIFYDSEKEIIEYLKQNTPTQKPEKPVFEEDRKKYRDFLVRI